MEYCAFVEPQSGSSYDDLLAFAKGAERLGFTGFFRSDHYLTMGNSDGLPGSSDAWTTLAGLARDTQRLRLGTLVSSVTYRHPGILAIQVANVDEMSAGRVELGLGTGWYAAEHAAYGIPFPDKRFGLLEENLAIVTGLWSTPPGATFDFAGEHYALADSPALPKPVQSRVPIIVGGGGPKRTPELAARYATEFNSFGAIAESPQRFDRVRAAAEAIGRDPGEIKFSAATTTFAGSDRAEVERRIRATGGDPAATAASPNATIGTVDQVVDRLGSLADLGVQRTYLQFLDIQDLDHLEFVGTEVLPRLR
jgi:F420-dependent oxidoreductase-like protein